MKWLILLLLLMPAVFAAQTVTDKAYVYIEIQPNPPQIATLSINPDPAYADSELNCDAILTDPSPNTEFRTAWYVNGEKADTLEFSPGDEVRCVSIPYRGSQEGDPKEATITIHKASIGSRAAKSFMGLMGTEARLADLEAHHGLLSMTGYAVSELGSETVPALNSLLFIAVIVLFALTARIGITLWPSRRPT